MAVISPQAREVVHYADDLQLPVRCGKHKLSCLKITLPARALLLVRDHNFLATQL